MKTIKILFSLLITGQFLSADAQTTKTFSLFSPSHQGTVVLQGDRSSLFPFIWTSGKGPQSTGVNYDYSLMFYEVGNTGTMIDNITKTCCATSFADTVLNFSGEKWADFLNGISLQLYGKDMAIGDTIELVWRVNLSAVSPGPSYAFGQSAQDFTVRFIRGQFNDEYVPVHHKTPSDFQHYFIEGDPDQTIPFSWTSAYCPGGCATASYDLLIDTVDGAFDYPCLTVSVPNNDSAWAPSFNTLDQLLKITGTPHGSSRQIYWKVLVYGNNQVLYSQKRGEFTLWNGLLNNENKPFSLVNPVNNFIIHLSGHSSTQLNFKWESTHTPPANPEFYYVVFDSAGASAPFNNPLLQFVAPGAGIDTALNIPYGKIDRGLDSLYPGWTVANLIWSVKASINTTFYYPTTAHNIQFNAGVLIGLEDEKNSLTIYPNPAKDQLVIPGSDRTREFRIFTANGQQVLRGSLEAGEGNISCSELPEGIYLLYVQDDESTGRAKVVISR